MIHWEKLCFNPLTGKTVWAVRSIPSGIYGTNFEWAVVIEKPHYFSTQAKIMLVQGMSLSKRKALQNTLLEKGFTSAKSYQHNKPVTWDIQGRRTK